MMDQETTLQDAIGTAWDTQDPGPLFERLEPIVGPRWADAVVEGTRSQWSGAVGTGERRPPRTGSLRGWLFGPIHTSPEPLPYGMSLILLRIRDGQPITLDDVREIARDLDVPLRVVRSIVDAVLP